MGEKYSSASNQEGSGSAVQLRQQIREEWRDLWDQRIEDKLVAEEIARKDYELLFIERGTVIRASKDYVPPDFEEIVRANEELLDIKLTYPDPRVGGWGKFIKDVFPRRTHHTRRKRLELNEKSQNGPRKSGGRGWLNRR